MELKNLILNRAKEIEDRLTAYRRKLHSIAETGFDMPKTIKLLEDALCDMGYCVRIIGKGAVVVQIGNGNGRTILLRADMDALPIMEESGESFASTNGNMHACGHDIHTAMLLGAADILSKYRDKIQGRIILAFQPAEEILEGAKDMLDSGILDCGIDFAMMIHVLTGITPDSGYAIIPSGGVSAPSSDFFKISVKGRSAHGSTPSAGSSAAAVASRVLLSIEELPSREFSVQDDVTVSVGTFNAGVAANVIPDRAELTGTARAYDEKTRERLIQRIETLAEGIGELYGCETELTVTSSCPTLLNDGVCSERTLTYARELFGDSLCVTSEQLGGRGGGSEDFAYISHRVPSVMVAMSAGSVSEGYAYSIHNPKVRFNESVIHLGAALYSYLALRFLD